MASVNALKWGLGWGKIVAIFVSVLVVAGAGLVFLGHNAFHNTLPRFPNLNSNQPQVFSGFSSSTGSSGTQMLANISKSYLSNVSQFSVSYYGSVYGSGSGLIGIVSASSPLYVGYSSRGPSQRFYINATSVSAFGDAEVTYLNLANGTFTCTNFNSTAIAYGNINNVFLGSRSSRCATGSEIVGFDLSRIAHFDFSQLQNFGMVLNYNTVYQSTYNGMPCTYIAGTLTQTNSSGGQTGQGAFGMCISNTYYVPLSIAAYLSGSSGAFSISLNETAISNSSSQGYTLPGPVV